MAVRFEYDLLRDFTPPVNDCLARLNAKASAGWKVVSTLPFGLLMERQVVEDPIPDVQQPPTPVALPEPVKPPVVVEHKPPIKPPSWKKNR